MQQTFERVQRKAQKVWTGERDDGLPPGPPLPAAAQLALWLYRPIPFLEGCRRRYGDTFSMQLPGQGPIITTSEPELVREIFHASSETHHAGRANEPLRPIVGTGSLLLLDGEPHLRERRLLLPPFHGARMHEYGAIMRDVTVEQMSREPVGKPVAIHGPMQAITLEVILRTVFGADSGRELDELSRSVIELTTSFTPLTMVPAFQRDLGPRSPWGRFLAARAATDARLYELIAARRREAHRARIDILSLMLAARYEDGTAMSDRALRDELVTLLAAGHETSATVLPWVFHFLTANLDVQARVHAELDRVCGGPNVDPEASNGLVYLDAVVKEAMRLRPVIAAVGRVVSTDTTLGRYRAARGTLVAPSIYLTHTNAAVWPDPYAFRPERFIDTKINPNHYLPFGGGVRRCIGMAFALFEMRMILAATLARFGVVKARGHVVRAERRNVTIAPSGGMPVVLTPRAS